MEKLVKITSKDTADNFFWWLSEHPEIGEIQGWRIERLFQKDDPSDNRPTAIGVSPRHIADVEFFYTERKAINDWVDRFLRIGK